MKKIICCIISLLLCFTFLTAGGCTEQNKVNDNLTTNAEKFNIYRRVALINLRTDKVEFECIGYLDVQYKKSPDRAWLTVEKKSSEDPDKGAFVRHSVLLNEWVTLIVEDLSEGTEVNKFKYYINYQPHAFMPFAFENNT